MQRDELNAETAKIRWQELQRFFANGSTIYVSPELDLIDVAMEICHDNKEKVEQWMTDSSVAQVTDEQAMAWLDDDVTVWSVVVKPWVLVQPIAS